MAPVIEEKNDQLRQLIAMGKERGYLLYDEVNEILPAEINSPEEIDDLLSTFERYGIDLYEDVSSAEAAGCRTRNPPTTDTETKEERTIRESRARISPDSRSDRQNQ